MCPSQNSTVGPAMMDWLYREMLEVSTFSPSATAPMWMSRTSAPTSIGTATPRVIATYIEAIKGPSQFMAVVKQLKKPLVFLKPGRTRKGRVTAGSHTRFPAAGADAIHDALFAKHGICRACTVGEFHGLAKAFAYLKPPTGNSILFITTSGGSAILATHQAEQELLDAAPLPAHLVDAVTPLIPTPCDQD